MNKTEAICITIVALLILAYLVFPEWAKYRLRMAELKMYKDKEDEPEFDVKHLKALAHSHNPLLCEICQEEIKLGSDCEKAEQMEAKTTQANRGEGITTPID